MRVMIRYGELTLKSRPVRNAFTSRLCKNIKDALRTLPGLEFRIERGWARSYAEIDDEAALPVLARVFGISSLSVVESHRFRSLDELIELASARFLDVVRGRRFAVRVRRSGQHSFGSQDLAVALGARLGREAKVDLTNPEVEAHVEVRNDTVSFFVDRLAGPGGLPLGVEGRALALVSGGYDSCVAAWRLMKRGVQLHFLFCALGGRAHQRSALRVLRRLAGDWCYGYRPILHLVDFGPVMEELHRQVPPPLWNLILKRQIFRAAEWVCRERGIRAIVTGDALGQVSSQTLVNLEVIDRATDLQVLRPLLGMDKLEIMREAERIGTYELSSRVKEYCAIAPHQARTRARFEEIADAERELDPGLAQRLAEAGEQLGLRDAPQPWELMDDDALETAEIPPGAPVLDIRTPEEKAAIPLEGSIALSPGELLAFVRSEPAWREFVILCDNGTLSRDLAAELREEGYNALSVRGGARGLASRGGARKHSSQGP